MSKKLQLKDYIPPNFDLEKYHQSVNYNAQQWLTNIFARLPASFDESESDADPKWNENNILTSNNILNLQQGAGRLISQDSHEYDFLEALINANQRISSLEVGAAMHLGEIKKHPSLKPFIDWFKQNGEIKEYPFGPYPNFTREWFSLVRSPAIDFIDNDNDPDYRDYAEIDLAKPDLVIKEEFDLWLKKARTRISPLNAGKTKYLSQAKFRRWFESRALPYIDLLHWNESEGRKLPHEVAGKIIFSDASKNDCRSLGGVIADTTITTMKEMFSRNTLELLAYQAKFEYKSKSTEETL